LPPLVYWLKKLHAKLAALIVYYVVGHATMALIHWWLNAREE
jgi:cytochrome b561